MRYLLPCLALAASATPLRAGEREDALALIDKAVKAHGGEDALKKARTAQRNGSGTLNQGDRLAPFVEESVFSLPERARMTLEVGGRQQRMVVTPDKAWQQQGGGPPADVDRETAESAREELYVQWLTTLLPLRQDGVTLALAADDQVSGRPAAVVKVSSKGRPDVRLFFDKQSGLLVKAERRARQAGLPVDKGYIFAEHKAFDGALLPTRYAETINGRRFIEMTALTWKLLPRVDDALFARP
jgi:hypothetical protein